MTASPSTLDQVHAVFAAPPRRFGPIPFWFWNDELDREELLRQLRAFHEAGCGGVLPHARVGLSRHTGYLTDTFLHLIRDVVEAARELGMSVILYDEGSYPSGSARGQVVAENPEYASQAIGLWDKEIEGPAAGYWRPNTGRALRDRHVVTCAAALADDGVVDPDSVRVLEAAEHDVIPYDLPAGRWRLLSVWNTDSGGHIRGAYPDEESGSATAPAAGDILNPDAVACFLRLTHERYLETVGDHFGDTVIAMFTDEPGVFGKSPQRPRDPRPFTRGFLDWLQAHWGEDPRVWLPALWVDYGPGTEAFRERYQRAVETRLHEVFYAAQRSWCGTHGLALTGHPGGSDDMASLAAFHLPGQDMVWRWVLPGAETALLGAHAVAPKAATSGARRAGARRVLTEVCGAYGWRHSLDEVKWLFDWHLVRGNNLINPHAFFYSIRGRRAWESEPDLGVHNAWWPHVGHLLRYANRISWLLADAEPVCSIGVLGDPGRLPSRAAAKLLTSQRDFCYLGPDDVTDGRVRNGRLRVGGLAYETIIVDGDPGPAAGDWRGRLAELTAAGGMVLEAEGSDFDARLAGLAPMVAVVPANADLRATHVRKAGLDLFLLVNEGEEAIVGQLQLQVAGRTQGWDPLNGSHHEMPGDTDGGGCRVALHLPRRGSLVLAVDPLDTAPARAEDRPQRPVQNLAIAATAWSVTDAQGLSVDLGGALTDWSRSPGRELFTGTLVYRTGVDVADVDPASTAVLDLGRVGDIAECFVDGERLGVCLWAPHRLTITDAGRRLEDGLHELEIHVTNSMANEFEGAQLPSGLLGPVHLEIS